MVAPSSITYKVQSINCPDSNNCFALIDHPSTPVLYKSIDQGRNWSLIYENNIERYPSVVEGISPNPNYYFFTENIYSFLWKSNDGGITFKKIQLDLGYLELTNLSVLDSNYGFVSNKYSYFITKDGWETFVRLPRLNNVTLYSPQFLDSNILVMTLVSDKNPYGFAFVKYYFNENRFDTLSFLGFNSGSDQTANDFQRIYHIYFVNDTLGFGCGSSRVHQEKKEYFDMIYRTTDGGYTWETVFRELNYPEVGLDNNISFADEKNGIAVGFYGKIAMTNDGGDTWVYEPHPNDMKNCRKMQVCWAGHTPLIGTWDRGIFRYEGDFFKFPEDTTGVEDNVITNNELLITPNPASEYIEIRYNTVGAVYMSASVEIYNVLGVCVKNVNPTLRHTPAPLERGFGEGVLKVDVSDLPTGVYFVRIGNLVEMFVKE
jgi:photosystem II stability/assembly factor-like uncharacterized protein